MKFFIIAFSLLFGICYGKPLNEPDDGDIVCAGYDACHAVDHSKINVHLVPHSHDDVGWLSTVEQYYFKDVQYIITSVVRELLDNPDRRFIYVETAFFHMWWGYQSEKTKESVRQLINEGRLEIINGAWSMNDEAAVHYQSTVDQYTLGLRFLEDELGKCARPKVGWQIDPFGHSREHASLLTQFGLDAVFFARVDYRDKDKRRNEANLDLLWTGSANLGNDTTLLASVLYNHYSAPGGFCFDISCDDAQIVTDKKSLEYNWEQRVNDFAQFAREEARHYPTNHILITLGDDFKWKAAYNYFHNLDLLIDGFQEFKPVIDDKEFNIFYSTPSCYTKAVNEYAEENKVNLEVKTDDFFPYADSSTTVWSGYFTSRPTSKRLERFANNLLQVTKQINAIGGQPYSINEPLSEALGVMQHHDAITGTEKVVVEMDYHLHLVEGMNNALSTLSSSLSSILGFEDDLNLKSCLLSNVSICAESDKDKFNVLIYNPLARSASHYIQIPVNDGTWQITGPSDEVVDHQLTDPIIDFQYVADVIKEKTLEKVLIFRAEDLPPLGYKIYTFERISTEIVKKPKYKDVVDQIGFEDKYVNFDEETGLLKSITLNGVTLDVSQKMFYYESADTSGAYIFVPKDVAEFGEVKNFVVTNEDDLIREIKQVWADWALQIIRIYKEEDYIEFDWVVGPIDILDSEGKEVVTRYTTGITDVDNVFYTDSNGREMIYRKKNYRPTYEYTDEEPVAGNYYPVNTKILVKNDDTEFAVLTDRSEGGASLNSGEIELMLSRTLLHDDSRGVGESLKELEYGKLLVARGSHFVTLGETNNGNEGRTMAAVERDIAQRKLLQPWVLYTTEDISVKQQSFLNEELPKNVHLLTLQSWGETENTLLIRLEHIFEKDEDPNLSKEVTVDLTDLFKTFKIVSLKEYMLAANTPLEENSRFAWSQIIDTVDKSSPLRKENRLARDDADLKISLAPMQIRTFVVTIETV